VIGGALLLAAAACAPATRQTVAPLACLAGPDFGRMIELPAGSFIAGDRPVYPEEGPPTQLRVEGFAIQIHEVTNDQFAAFVAATAYVTDAERSTKAGGAGAGGAVFDRTARDWRLLPGATWRSPDGPGSSIAGRGTEPVVQVSWRDASAYARWAGARLPDEMDWEYAAAHGLRDPADPASDAFDAKGAPRANSWQGVFPVADTGEDGFAGRAPVGCFPANRDGVFDLIGNVWEWTATPGGGPGQYVVKGGSHLCAPNFCGRYRPAARQVQDADFSTNHIGFRIVKPTPAHPR
jgi:formylglycine-generating enzyme required for sulfatase activity